MARCGCDPKCNCVFKDGTCTKIEISSTASAGCGDPTFTYAVDILTDNQTVFCGPNGLNTTLNHIDTNTIDLEGTGSAGSPLEAHVIRTPDGNVPDPDALGTGNLLKELPGAGGGIYVSCEDVQDCVGSAIDAITTDCLDYDDATNTISIKICTEPNGIECIPVGDAACPTGGLAVIPSSDVGNSLTFGTDDRLFTAATAIAPGDCMTFAGTGTAADPFVISPQIAPELNGVECVPGQGLLVTPSSDANNGLVFGGDTRLFINRCPLTVGASQILTGNTGPCFEFVGGDCTTPMVATLRLSDDVCQGLSCGLDGLYVQIDPTDLPTATELITNFGPFGPFNGLIDGPLPGGSNGIILEGPTCINIVNPSQCRDMVTTGILSGFADTGRTAGGFRLRFEISNAGPAGPWFQVSQMGQATPMPASRFTSNAIWSGNEQTIPPGGNRQLCTRLTFGSGPGAGSTAVTAGRVFSGSRTLTITGRWVTE